MPYPEIHPTTFVDARVNISDICDQLLLIGNLIDFVNWCKRKFDLPVHVEFEGRETLLVVRIRKKDWRM